MCVLPRLLLINPRIRGLATDIFGSGSSDPDAFVLCAFESADVIDVSIGVKSLLVHSIRCSSYWSEFLVDKRRRRSPNVSCVAGSQRERQN